MYFEQEDLKTIEACRFCFMCRHVCPVGNATGNETNHPRARALILSMVNRKTAMTADIAEAMYECSLCGACSNSCEVGFDPPTFTRAARLKSLAEQKAPSRIVEIISQIDKTGSPYPITSREFANLPLKADTLLFFGCNTSTRTAANAVKLLQAAGVPFMIMPDEPCCGLYKADYMGKAEEARLDMVRTAAKINQTGTKTIVSVCPSCTKAFHHEYPQSGTALEAKVVTLTSFLAGLIADGRLKPKKSDLLVTYHDPCRLARDLDETEPARAIISACANLKEMHLHGKDTVCCGGGTLSLYRPDITEKTARRRWDNALSTGAAALVTACPTCQDIMGRVPSDMRLIGIDELLIGSLV